MSATELLGYSLKRVKHPLVIKSDGTSAKTEISVGGNLLHSVRNVSTFIRAGGESQAIMTIGLSTLDCSFDEVSLLFNTDGLTVLNRRDAIATLEKLLNEIKEETP